MNFKDISDEDWLAFSMTAPKLYKAHCNMMSKMPLGTENEWFFTDDFRVSSEEYFEIGGVRYLPVVGVSVFDVFRRYLSFIENGVFKSIMMEFSDET